MSRIGSSFGRNPCCSAQKRGGSSAIGKTYATSAENRTRLLTHRRMVLSRLTSGVFLRHRCLPPSRSPHSSGEKVLRSAKGRGGAGARAVRRVLPSRSNQQPACHRTSDRAKPDGRTAERRTPSQRRGQGGWVFLRWRTSWQCGFS